MGTSGSASGLTPSPSPRQRQKPTRTGAKSISPGGSRTLRSVLPDSAPKVDPGGDLKRSTRAARRARKRLKTKTEQAKREAEAAEKGPAPSPGRASPSPKKKASPRRGATPPVKRIRIDGSPQRQGWDAERPVSGIPHPLEPVGWDKQAAAQASTAHPSDLALPSPRKSNSRSLPRKKPKGEGGKAQGGKAQGKGQKGQGKGGKGKQRSRDRSNGRESKKNDSEPGKDAAGQKRGK